MTLTIHTCDKFSDIWDPTTYLLNKNWADRNVRTLFITDAPTNREFENIEVISTEAGLDMPKRMSRIIDDIETEYLFYSLDDYFLIHKIDTQRIEQLLDLMDYYSIDYLSFKNFHKVSRLLDEKEALYELDLYSGEDYVVNLYPGIWRTSFMKKSLEEEKNIWEYEASLTAYAQREKATCAVAKGGQFEILDGICKGLFFHKSYRYLTEHQLYQGDRGVHKYRTEFKLWFLTFLKRILPQSISRFLKNCLKKFGFKFYS